MPRFLPLFTAVVLLSTACGNAAGDTETDTQLQAVASVYPLAWLAETIAPEATVTFLAASGQDPHDLELSPHQRADVEQADVALYLGDIDFQPQVEAALAARSGAVVDAADTLGAQALLHIEAHEHEDEEHDEAEGEGVDAHLWFDPALMAQLATATGEAFAAADPTNEADYRASAETTAQELRQLEGDLADLLSACRHDEVIVSHEAYAYLLAPHGLTQHGISSAAGHAEASPQDISRLVEEIHAEGITAVLSEPVEGRNDAETLAREAGIELIEILSLDIVDQAQAEVGFPALLREQAEAVARAAQCEGA